LGMQPEKRSYPPRNVYTYNIQLSRQLAFAKTSAFRHLYNL